MDAVDGFILMLLLFVAVCVVLKFMFLFGAIRSLFQRRPKEHVVEDPADVAEQAIAKARRNSRRQHHE